MKIVHNFVAEVEITHLNSSDLMQQKGQKRQPAHHDCRHEKLHSCLENYSNEQSFHL